MRPMRSSATITPTWRRCRAARRSAPRHCGDRRSCARLPQQRANRVHQCGRVTFGHEPCGSPVYRAERIEAPLLILHGRNDKRVVPLMTEQMVEALEIEGKRFEVHWYDDEGHGWERRENRRDAFERILAFLKANVLDETPD